ncbi:SwmB domain-containing protein, partial [Chromatium okenii]|uniref:SwmB domain-containing protein n=1 Tax=Chromatium okenii TaxID=61644 RepID=UPI0026EEB629
MASTNGNDFNIIQTSDVSTTDKEKIIGAIGGDDVYIITPHTLVGANGSLTISDTGSNEIQLVSGLEIRSSTVSVADDGAITLLISVATGTDTSLNIKIFNANLFSFDSGGNITAGITGSSVSCEEFVKNVLKVELPPKGSKVNSDVPVFISDDTTPVPTDTTPPTFDSATANGTTLMLTYTDESSLATVTLGDELNTSFFVNVGESTDLTRILVNNVEVDATAKTVTLTLEEPIEQGQKVTVSYNDLSGGENGIRDVAGNDAVSFTSKIVSNQTDNSVPELLYAIVERTSVEEGVTTTLKLAYSSKLDPNNLPSNSTFVVTVDGENKQVTGVKLSSDGEAVILGLTDPITEGAAVNVSYWGPRGDTAIQNLSGNDASPFMDHTVISQSNQAPVIVEDQSFVVTTDAADGATLGTVLATDADGTIAGYAITDGNVDTDGDETFAFKLDATTGELTVADAVDLVNVGPIALTVVVTDNLDATDSATVTVEVTAPPTETYTIATDAEAVIEGNSANFTVSTTGLEDGAEVAYTLSGDIDETDVAALTGT